VLGSATPINPSPLVDSNSAHSNGTFIAPRPAPTVSLRLNKSARVRESVFDVSSNTPVVVAGIVIDRLPSAPPILEFTVDAAGLLLREQ